MSFLDKYLEPKCVHRHNRKTHPNCFDENGNPLKPKEERRAKILIFDVETLPLVFFAWNPFNQYITADKLIKDWCILSYSAKWVGDDKIISDVLTPKEAIERNDKELVIGFWKLLDQADVVITHNGKRFDIKKLNTRFWKNGLHKPHSYKVIDTLTTAKAVFGMTYNSLDFIAKFTGSQEKLDTNFDLWRRCDSGDREALEYMREYNEHDAVMQEEIYLKMREWIPNHPNLALYSNLKDVCPVCLGKNFKQIGVYTAEKKQYKEFRCSCGSVWHDSKSIERGEKE